MEETNMVIRQRDDIRHRLALAVTLGRGEEFSLYHLLAEEEWCDIILNQDAPLIVGGAVLGAVDGLRRLGATPPDVLSCPTVSPGGYVSERDMATAAGWLADGLLDSSDADIQARVSRGLFAHRWTQDPARVTALVVAIAVVASHAGDHDRG